MFNSKKIFAILSLTILLLVLSSFVLAKDLEVKYPTIGEKTPAPTSTEAKLTDYIRYIFALSIRIAGFIALGVMIYGGIKWLVSGGSPGKIADARSQILGGFLGIVILLSSYLILKTINPVLVSTSLYKEPTADCSKCSFNQATGEIDGCGGHEEWKEYCKGELDYYLAPGVYLLGKDEKTERVHILESHSNLIGLTNEVNPNETIDLNGNKITAIQFGRKNEDDHYCAILHRDENFEGPVHIFCETSNSPLTESPEDPINYGDSSGFLEEVKSVTVFQKDPEAKGTFTIYNTPGWIGNDYADIDVSGEKKEINLADNTYGEVFFPGTSGSGTYSIKIDGNLLIILCGKDYSKSEGKFCLPFTKNNEDLTKTIMGRCAPIFPEELPLFVVTQSCVDSIIAYPIKPMMYPW